MGQPHCPASSFFCTAQHLHFYELVSKSLTTSTPDRRLLAPNHTKEQDQAMLSAQVPGLVLKAASSAVAGSAVSCRVAVGRFPTSRNRHSSHQATTKQAEPPPGTEQPAALQDHHQHETQCQCQAAEIRRSREGGRGESGSSVQGGDASRSPALPEHRAAGALRCRDGQAGQGSHSLSAFL